jgi:hypothetical protein
MAVFYAVPGSVADGYDLQYTHVEVERRVSSATGAPGNTLQPETGRDLTSKASQVRISFSLLERDHGKY